MSLAIPQGAYPIPQEWQDSLKTQLMEQEASRAWIKEIIVNRT